MLQCIAEPFYQPRSGDHRGPIQYREGTVFIKGHVRGPVGGNLYTAFPTFCTSPSFPLSITSLMICPALLAAATDAESNRIINGA